MPVRRRVHRPPWPPKPSPVAAPWPAELPCVVSLCFPLCLDVHSQQTRPPQPPVCGTRPSGWPTLTAALRVPPTVPTRTVLTVACQGRPNRAPNQYIFLQRTRLNRFFLLCRLPRFGPRRAADREGLLTRDAGLAGLAGLDDSTGTDNKSADFFFSSQQSSTEIFRPVESPHLHASQHFWVGPHWQSAPHVQPSQH